MILRETLTEQEAIALLRRRVERAGSMLALADGNRSLQGMISGVLAGKRPVTQPRVLDLLGLHIVFAFKSRE